MKEINVPLVKHLEEHKTVEAEVLFIYFLLITSFVFETDLLSGRLKTESHYVANFQES